MDAWDAVRSPAVAALSTDVFDTLVWRQVPEPVDAFPLVAERLRAQGKLAPGLAPDAFGRLRAAAEAEARTHRRHLGDAEATLQEIYAMLPAWVFAGAAPSWEVAELEVAMERDLIVPDLDMVELLDFAQQQGKLLVAVSDTYFSADHLRSLFAQPVLARLQFDRIFTSSEHRTNKSGGLFEIALRELSLEPEQVVHLGDNREADIEIPGKLGVRTVYFERRPEPFDTVARKEERFLPDRADAPHDTALVSGLTAARSKVLSRLERAALPPNLQPFWSYGATVLGPVFTGFVEWIHEHAARLEASRVLCLMREGSLLGELITRANAYLGAEVDAQPFWVNRGLCLRAGISEVSREELEKVLSRRSTPTIAEACETLGLRMGELPEYASHAATTLDDPILRASLLGHMEESPALRARILDEARRTRERIVAYSQLMMGDDPEAPVVMADLGWGATIQGELGRVLEQAGSPRRLVGLYLLTNVRAARQVFTGIEARGFLGDFGFPERSLDVIMRSPELLEQICMPPHGSQVALDGDLEPVLEPFNVPALQQVEADATRKGMFAFQREWARYQTALPGKIGSLASVPRLLRPILLRSIASPTAEEAALYGRWQHDAGQGSEDTETVADLAALPRLRYMSPDQARDLPMTELYWPFGLASLVDDHWPDLMSAAAAGQIGWDALAAPLDTGQFVVEPTRGVGVGDWTRQEAVPQRNRLGLSMVHGSLRAPQIQEVTVRPSERAAVLRFDWMEFRCWTQGRAEPLVVRLEGAGLSRLKTANCFHLNPDVFIAHTSAPSLSLDLADVTWGVVFRVDYEVAFSALAISDVLPASGRFRDLEHAGRHIDALEARLTGLENTRIWKASAPLRSLRRRLR